MTSEEDIQKFLDDNKEPISVFCKILFDQEIYSGTSSFHIDVDNKTISTKDIHGKLFKLELK